MRALISAEHPTQQSIPPLTSSNLKSRRISLPRGAVACNQFETHPYYQREELFAYCQSAGIAVTAHSSMGGTNNAMRKFHASPPLTDDATINSIAEKHATTPQAVLLAWGVQRPTAIL